MTRTHDDEHLVHLLSSIRDSVLQDVHLTTPRRIGTGSVALGLGTIGLIGAEQARHSGHWLMFVGNLLFAVLAVVTLVGLSRMRFAWCCAGACVGGVSTVAGAGAFWWGRTGQLGTSLPVAALCTLTAAALTAHWVAVVVSPLERSQPDMRAARSGVIGRRP